MIVSSHIENMALSVSIAAKRFKGAETPVLENVRFEAVPGEILSVLGPSGCGKTTLLRIIAGLDSDFEGQVTRTSKEQHNSSSCGFVFQDARLLPWYTVAQNIEFGIPKDTPKHSKSEILRNTLRLTHLESYSKYLPQQLSGGVQKLTAIGRALAVDPELMLLDEPFSSLDPASRFGLHDAFLRIQREGDFATILVTHDVDEAIYLSDRIIVLGGKPATVVEVLSVDLASPRERFSAEANDIRAHLLRYLM